MANNTTSKSTRNDQNGATKTPPIQYPIDEDGRYVTHIAGLEYYRHFLSADQQTELLALIDQQSWSEGIIARRQQFYGEVYYHTAFQSKILQPQLLLSTTQGVASHQHHENEKEVEVKSATSSASLAAATIMESSESTMTSEEGQELKQQSQKQKQRSNPNHDEIGSSSRGIGIPIRESGMLKWLNMVMPYFRDAGYGKTIPSQVLINEYKNNMGIASHFEDREAFGPMICTLSLVESTYLTLKKPTDATNQCTHYTDIVKILLEPGSLLIMKADARYHYRHGIGKFKWVHVPEVQPQQVAAARGGEQDQDPTTHKRDATFVGNMMTSTQQPQQARPNHKIIQRSIKRDASYRRVSVTIRHLLATRRTIINENDDETHTKKDPNKY